MSRKGRLLVAASLLSSHVPHVAAIVFPSNHESYKFDYLSYYAWSKGVAPSGPTKRDENDTVPLIITNSCPETVWPGIRTQNGDGPETSGFELPSGETRDLKVGPTWQGRVWGRTNCTADGETATCSTGDCFGKLECDYGGEVPVTLAEFNLAGGVAGNQCFYDISLVDGYNLPVGIVYHPTSNTTWIPPNLVNPICIATPGYLMTPNRTGLSYTNSSYPMPYDTLQTNEGISNWCPWDLQVFPPEKPGDGVYPYPDDDVQRPVFDPCKSACAANNQPMDCCTGEYNDPTTCGPSEYSKSAKAMCPDAYSYAFDDQTSTFIIPSGGGWEVVFCPEGRSTNILETFGQELHQIAESGHVSDEVRLKTMDIGYIESVRSGAAGLKTRTDLLAPGVVVMMGAVLFLLS